jgi:hypothetical protein
MARRDPKTGKHTSGDWLGKVLRGRAAERSGLVPDGRDDPAQSLAEGAGGAENGAQDASTPGVTDSAGGQGFGGGFQGVDVPQGESLGDAIRRKVYGG